MKIYILCKAKYMYNEKLAEAKLDITGISVKILVGTN